MLNKNIIIERAGKVEIIECVAKIEDGFVDIIIENNSDMRRVINERTLIGKISECEIVNSICNEDELKSYIFDQCEVVSSISTDTQQTWKPSTMLKIKNDSLSKDQIFQLKQLADKYWMIFSRNDEDISIVHARFGEHDIELTNSKPIKQ
jgi:hypothetical protein